MRKKKSVAIPKDCFVLCQVTWVDPSGPQGWSDMEETTRTGAMDCLTVGWIRRYPDFVMIVSTMASIENLDSKHPIFHQSLNALKLPIGCIKHVAELEAA
jgi:hypothetical protein